MTVKRNQQEIDALEKKVAELEGRLAQASETGKKGFSVKRAQPKGEARETILSRRSKEPKTYRALTAGTDYRQGFIPAGKVFTTDMPQGEWMEEVGGKEAEGLDEAHGNQFAVGPDLHTRIDRLEGGTKAEQNKRPRKADDE